MTQATEKARHTPGPWHVLRARTLTNIKGPNGEQICQLPTRREADICLIAAAPRQHEVLGQVFDSPGEPDKWLQNVRFALQQADGIERRPQSAEAHRDELRVQRAAPELAEALRFALHPPNREQPCGCYSNSKEEIQKAIQRLAREKKWEETHAAGFIEDAEWHSDSCFVPIARAALKKAGL